MSLKDFILDKADSFGSVLSDPQNKIADNNIIKNLHAFLYSYNSTINNDNIKLYYQHFPDYISLLLDRYVESNKISNNIEQLKSDNKYYFFKDIYRSYYLYMERNRYDTEQEINILNTINNNILSLNIFNISIHSHEEIINILIPLLYISYGINKFDISHHLNLIDKYLRYDNSLTEAELSYLKSFLSATKDILTKEKIRIANKIDYDVLVKTGNFQFLLDEAIPDFFYKIEKEEVLNQKDFEGILKFLNNHGKDTKSLSSSYIESWNKYCESEYIKENKNKVLSWDEKNEIFIELNHYICNQIENKEFFINLFNNIISVENRENPDKDLIFFTILYKSILDSSINNPTYMFDTFYFKGILRYTYRRLFLYPNIFRNDYYDLSLFNKYCSFYNFEFNKEKIIHDDHKEQEHFSYCNYILSKVEHILPLYFDEKLIYNKYSQHYSAIKNNDNILNKITYYCKNKNIDSLYMSDLFKALGKKDISQEDKKLFISTLEYLAS